MRRQNGVDLTVRINSIAIIRCIATELMKELARHYSAEKRIPTWKGGTQIACFRETQCAKPGSGCILNSPDKVACQSRGNNLVEPSSINRCLVRCDTELFQDDGFVGLLHASSVISNPLCTPGLFVATLAPWCWV